MKACKIFFGLTAIALSATTVSHATEFRSASVRALGMGGSNVATTNGVDASYWNPAAYGFFGADDSSSEMKAVDNSGLSNKDFGLGIDAGAGVSLFGPIADNVNILQNMQIPTGNANAGLSPSEIVAAANFTKDFSSLDPALGGLNVSVDATIGARVLNYGIGVHQFVDINAGVAFDNQNTGLGGNAAFINAFTNGGATIIPGMGAFASPGGYFTVAQQDSLRTQLVNTGYTADQAAAIVGGYDAALQAGGVPASDSAVMSDALITLATAPGDFQNNGTSIETRGVSVREIGFTYGYAINESLSIGTVIKQLSAEMIIASADAFGSTNTLSNTQDATGSETASGLGLDLGLMYRIPNWQFGLTARNVNAPSFEHSSGYVYEMKPQVKLGAAWVPSSEFSVELGYDATENEGAVSGSKSKYWNFGLEWDAWKVLALRAGAYKNMAQDDIGTVASVGLGLNLWAMRLDMAYAQSNKKVAFEGDEIPVYAMASVALAIDF